jgi:hypothetical protein
MVIEHKAGYDTGYIIPRMTICMESYWRWRGLRTKNSIQIMARATSLFSAGKGFNLSYFLS